MCVYVYKIMNVCDENNVKTLYPKLFSVKLSATNKKLQQYSNLVLKKGKVEASQLRN